MTSSSKPLILHHYYRSSCSWRVRWALQIKKVPCQLNAVNLLKEEQKSDVYLNMNATGFVPCLELNEESFGESVAILEWLEESFPSPPLLPNAPADRLKVRQLCQIIASGTQPLQNLEVQKMISDNREDQLDWSRTWIERGLNAYEISCSKTAGTFSFGSSLTLADLCLIPQVYNALRFQVDLNRFPRVKSIYHHCLKLKECQDSAPDRYAP